MTMPAGKYYVGDLCYVLHDCWDEVCDLIISGNSCVDGEFTMKDGSRFACYGTKWGDGCYEDQYAREYSVDAGLIGCISVRDIDLGLRDMTNGVGPRFGGQLMEFVSEFTTSGDPDGMIIFGDVEINTDPSYDDFEEGYAEGDEF